MAPTNRLILTAMALAANLDTGLYYDDGRKRRPSRKPEHDKPTKFCGDCINGKKKYCKIMNKSIAKTTPACKNHYESN